MEKTLYALSAAFQKRKSETALTATAFLCVFVCVCVLFASSASFFRLRACKESSAERVYCIKQSELCRKAVLLFAFKLLT